MQVRNLKGFLLLVLFVVLVAACAPGHTATPTQAPQQGAAAGKWNGIPVFPGAQQSSSAMESRSYSVAGKNVGDVVAFYKERMKSAGWELLGVGKTSVKGIGDAYVLWFSKGNDLLIAEIFEKGGKVIVNLRFE